MKCTNKRGHITNLNKGAISHNHIPCGVCVFLTLYSFYTSLTPYFDGIVFCFPFAIIFDLVYDVEVIFHLGQIYHQLCKKCQSLFYSYKEIRVCSKQWASLWENRLFAYAKTKMQISFAVTAKLISVFVFATQIVRSLYSLSPKFQASSHLPWLYSLVCVWPGLKPRTTGFLTMRLKQFCIIQHSTNGENGENRVLLFCIVLKTKMR